MPWVATIDIAEAVVTLLHREPEMDRGKHYLLARYSSLPSPLSPSPSLCLLLFFPLFCVAFTTNSFIYLFNLFVSDTFSMEDFLAKLSTLLGHNLTYNAKTHKELVQEFTQLGMTLELAGHPSFPFFQS